MRLGITCYPSHGGSGVVATELGLKLASRGSTVAFISYAAPLRLVNLPPRVCFHEVPVEEYPLLKQYPYTLALAAKMAEVARSHRLDVFHVHYAIPFTAAAILAREMVPELDIKIVTTLHGTDITLVGANASFHQITAFSIERSDAVTAVSESLRQQTIDTFQVQREIQVIHNFIDPQHYECRETDPRRVGQKQLIYISNFRPVKRAGDVVKILAEVRKRVDARLLLVGDGPDMGNVLALARDLGVHEHIRQVGVVDDVSRFLRESDVLLLPSQTESFGLAALEAMATCVPVVATATGGLPEVVEHGVSGFLGTVGEISSLSGYVLELLTDGDLSQRVGTAGRQRAVQHFSADRIIPVFEDLYRRVRGTPG